MTRGRVSELRSAPLPVPGIGRARWLVELIRARAGNSFDLEMEACDCAGHPVFLPMWPIDRRQRQASVTSPSADGPLIIPGRARNRRVITAAYAFALDLGLRVGMTVSRAQALVPDLCVEADDAAADAAALERLALWLLQRIAPLVSADPPKGIVIDSTGTDHLHGGEAAMLEALAGKLALSASPRGWL